MSSQELKYKNKIITITLLGGEKVGKTCISERLIGLDFKEDYMATIGNEILYRDFDHKTNRKITVKIWDTAGQERFRSIAIGTIRKSKGVIFVYDITNRESFEKMKSLVKEAQNQVGELKSIIFGNKSDLYKNEEVTEEEGKKFAYEIGANFCLVSAKDNINIEEGFKNLIEQIPMQETQNLIVLSNSEKTRRKQNCCGASGSYSTKKTKTKSNKISYDPYGPLLKTKTKESDVHYFPKARKLTNCERCLTCCGYYACKDCLKAGCDNCSSCICEEDKCSGEDWKDCCLYIACWSCFCCCCFNKINHISESNQCCCCCHCPKQGDVEIYGEK